MDDQPTSDAESGGETDDRIRSRLAADDGYALNSLPSTAARALAFAAVVVAGCCGGLIGFAIVDLQCDGSCTIPTALGAIAGALLAAVGVGIVAVLVLRAMSEWKDVAPVDRR
ncbi:MAG: hypothetical protein AAFZ07_27250 [Actinomycetota bacterium]